MQYESIRDCYKELTKHSLENAVDILWTNILREYFLNREGFQLVVQGYVDDRHNKKANDVTVRYVKNGRKKSLILIEDKRVLLEGQSAIWSEAFDELTEYMRLARGALPNDQPAERMFGIVTVGHYSRFYIMDPGDSTLRNHQATQGEYLEFKKDEEELSTCSSRSRPRRRAHPPQPRVLDRRTHAAALRLAPALAPSRAPALAPSRRPALARAPASAIKTAETSSHRLLRLDMTCEGWRRWKDP